MAIAAAALLSQTLPAAAQGGGGYGAQACREIRGHVVCSGDTWARGMPGSHAYDRWSNGNPALGGSTSPDSYQFPQYLGGHNAWYGFGR